MSLLATFVPQSLSPIKALRRSVHGALCGAPGAGRELGKIIPPLRSRGGVVSEANDGGESRSPASAPSPENRGREGVAISSGNAPA